MSRTFSVATATDRHTRSGRVSSAGHRRSGRRSVAAMSQRHPAPKGSPAPPPDDIDRLTYELRRLLAEALGTFFLVLVAVAGPLVNARFGGQAIPLAAQVAAPGLMVGVVILSLGAVSGAHLNPGVSLAFAIRGDFPWRRVPGYLVAQLVGAVLATVLLVALLGRQGTAGLTLPGSGIGDWTAAAWEALLSVGLVTTILGTASGAQNVGPLAAIGVASYIILAGIVGAPVSGASMNVARSLGPALVLGDFTAWWAYVVGPLGGAVIAAGLAQLLRGPGGGFAGSTAAQGTLGWLWLPGPIDRVSPGPAPRDAASPDANDVDPRR
jgi:aquaporin Z